MRISIQANCKSNALYMGIPKYIVQELNLNAQDIIDVKVIDGKIIAVKVSK